MTALSIRRLWKLYKGVATSHEEYSQIELALLQDAFYGGARSVLMVLYHLAEGGEFDELHATIGRLGREARAIGKQHPRARH